MEVMGYQVHAIGKAIRPLFADPVTNTDNMGKTKSAIYNAKINDNLYLIQTPKKAVVKKDVKSKVVTRKWLG